MGLFGSMVGGLVGIGGSIFGGINAARAMSKVKDSINTQKTKNEAWYNRSYNEDATQRADAQAILTQTKEQMRAANRQAAATSAVMGGSGEAEAAQKAASAQAMADAASKIAADATRRKDAVEAQYLANDANLQEKLNNMEMGKAQAISEAVKGVSEAGARMGDMF